jgi:hypothetical protein
MCKYPNELFADEELKKLSNLHIIPLKDSDLNGDSTIIDLVQNELLKHDVDESKLIILEDVQVEMDIMGYRPRRNVNLATCLSNHWNCSLIITAQNLQTDSMIWRQIFNQTDNILILNSPRMNSQMNQLSRKVFKHPTLISQAANSINRYTPLLVDLDGSTRNKKFRLRTLEELPHNWDRIRFFCSNDDETVSTRRDGSKRNANGTRGDGRIGSRLSKTNIGGDQLPEARASSPRPLEESVENLV